jgi:hypothetical protein
MTSGHGSQEAIDASRGPEKKGRLQTTAEALNTSIDVTTGTALAVVGVAGATAIVGVMAAHQAASRVYERSLEVLSRVGSS